MGKYTGNDVLNGTWGRVWVNNELWADVISFEAKVTGEFEDINFCDDAATYKRYMGFTGEGTIVFKKVDSKVTKLLADAYKKGVMPDIKIVGKLDDPAKGGAERVELLNVIFTEFTILKFAAKELLEGEVPFSFSDYNTIDLI